MPFGQCLVVSYLMGCLPSVSCPKPFRVGRDINLNNNKNSGQGSTFLLSQVRDEPVIPKMPKTNEVTSDLGIVPD